VNISTGVETSLIELYHLIENQMGVNLAPIIQELEFGEISRSSLDNYLAQRLLNWQPLISIKDGITKSIKT
jgi:UDP-glucose 4-epimerase